MKEQTKNKKISSVQESFQFIFKTTLWYCLKCREKTDSKNPKVGKTNTGKPIILPKYLGCDAKKLRFIKDQEASGLLSSLRITTPLSQIPLVDPLLS